MKSIYLKKRSIIVTIFIYCLSVLLLGNIVMSLEDTNVGILDYVSIIFLVIILYYFAFNSDKNMYFDERDIYDHTEIPKPFDSHMSVVVIGISKYQSMKLLYYHFPSEQWYSEDHCTVYNKSFKWIYKPEYLKH